MHPTERSIGDIEQITGLCTSNAARGRTPLGARVVDVLQPAAGRELDAALFECRLQGGPGGLLRVPRAPPLEVRDRGRADPGAAGQVADTEPRQRPPGAQLVDSQARWVVGARAGGGGLVGAARDGAVERHVVGLSGLVEQATQIGPRAHQFAGQGGRECQPAGVGLGGVDALAGAADFLQGFGLGDERLDLGLQCRNAEPGGCHRRALVVRVALGANRAPDGQRPGAGISPQGDEGHATVDCDGGDHGGLPVGSMDGDAGPKMSPTALVSAHGIAMRTDHPRASG